MVLAPKEEEEAEQAQAEMTESERLAVRFKTILYLRHRLQKGFLTRDKAPEESEMADMNKHISALENHQDLEVNIIKETKIHKVLKGIVKLASIPRDDEFQFKKRSSALLEIWNQRIDAAGDVPSKPTEDAEEESADKANGEAQESAAVKETNGDSHDAEPKSEDKEEDKAADKAEEIAEEKNEEAADETEDKAAAEPETKEASGESTDKDGDVAME